ncbi:glycosyltransferase [Desulfocurvibacter africanus PCS]|uniref:Glycosyltransferase n=1 Tax=Desulfocurvibacter africanus PCS TaxID=1262666 RepID=M5PWX1_DESAF|nr:glycosyltransferase family 4 protein [Desulfocurvibacter africanus]EMG38817.1 glycosyltransferase [Desulfocurvibacter africanus PCS]
MERKVIGMILKGYPRISETFISNEILQLESLGFRIHIISMREPREDFTHGNVRRIRAQVSYLPTELTTGLPRLLPPFLSLWRERPRETRTVLALAWSRYRRTRRLATLKHLLQGAYIVRKILPGSGITHLHAHFAHSPTSVAMFASLFSRLPFSFTAHAKDVWTQEAEQLGEKIDLARFVVTCTRANREYLTRLGSGRTPVHAVYHGIDLRFFAPNGRLLTARPPFRILTVARLTGKKGLDTVLRAIKLLRQRGFAFHYELVGDGEQRAQMEALVGELGLEDVVSMPGVQAHEVIREQFRQADVFVLGSRIQENGDRDGIPNVLAESMAMGVPVVATSVSALPEIVEDGITGLLVPPDDAQAMAAALERALTDQEMRQRMIPAAQKKVRQCFDNLRLIQDLATILRHEVPGT